MSYVRVWVHAVWSTKHRAKILTDYFRPILFKHILENAREKGIFIDQLNGYTDHVHCLIALRRGHTISDTIQLIKGESSYWTNNIYGKLEHKLIWQKEYYAVSVSESVLEQVRNYIIMQEVFHRENTFEYEVDKFVEKYNLDKLIE